MEDGNRIILHNLLKELIVGRSGHNPGLLGIQAIFALETLRSLRKELRKLAADSASPP